MKTKTFYIVDQKEKKAPQNVAELIHYCRRHFPDSDLSQIDLELGVVSLTLNDSGKSKKPSRQLRYNKNPR